MSIDRKKLHNTYRLVISWFYPNVCPYCNKFIEYDKAFCVKCEQRLRDFDGHFNIEYVDGFAAGCVYDDFSKVAVLMFKKTDCGNTYYAFASKIAEALGRSDEIGDIDYIVPIPIHKKKYNQRGYNQTELIAKELRYMIGVPYSNILLKVRNTFQQKEMHGSDRALNQQGAYIVSPKAPDIKGKSLLLLDDVCTTGSTFAETAGVLKAAGAEKVYAAAYAKVRKKSPVSLPEESH